jgi:hypothetical protein
VKHTDPEYTPTEEAPKAAAADPNLREEIAVMTGTITRNADGTCHLSTPDGFETDAPTPQDCANLYAQWVNTQRVSVTIVTYPLADGSIHFELGCAPGGVKLTEEQEELQLKCFLAIYQWLMSNVIKPHFETQTEPSSQAEGS